MGRNSKAGKRNTRQKEWKKMTDEARQVTNELERSFSRRMMPIALHEAFILLLNCGCIVLHDDHGFGKKRLSDWADHMMNTLECLFEQYVTIDELSEEVMRMTGLRYALTSDEVETLKEYGLKGLAHEAAFNDEQSEYWSSLRSRGWENNVNRYGKEVV